MVVNEISSQRKKIMVVDDDAFILEIIKNTLEDAGYAVSTVDNGRAAVDQIRKANPDLVLLDIKMPGLDGYEVLNSIRQFTEIPVIMLTGVLEPDAVARSMELGANDYIRKPFLPGELIARIKSKLRRSSR